MNETVRYKNKYSTTFKLKLVFSKSDKKFEKMFKQYAVICLFGIQDVNASVDIFNDMQMLKMNEVSSSEKIKIRSIFDIYPISELLGITATIFILV